MWVILIRVHGMQNGPSISGLKLYKLQKNHILEIMSTISTTSN